MIESEFLNIILPLENNYFEKLSNSIDFENVGKGRIGNHLVKVSDDKIPLVRTTTQYNIPAFKFSNIHNFIENKIIEEFRNHHNIFIQNFNNALIEVYDINYTKMNYHSDQCLDLERNSYIALFTCYERPEELTIQSLRKLKVKNKTTQIEYEIILKHNSVVLFSLQTNFNNLHKIVLEPVKNLKPLKLDNKWLGITFRTSKTLIQFNNKLPYFSNGDLLELANESQKSEFFKLRGLENNEIDFVYPYITYTLSKSDFLEPLIKIEEL